jgi:hypothetical protein
MKEYLKSWIPKIQDFSLKLDNLTKVHNQPWVLKNDLNDFVKVIFQPKGKLLVSKNGIITEGSWELISTTNSIILEINNEKRLYNHQFIDNGLLILKIDGNTSDYFVLANQNIIPDLDVKKYLISKYSKPLPATRKIKNTQSDTITFYKDSNLFKPKNEERVVKFICDNGKLSILTRKNQGYEIGDRVKLDNKTVKSGKIKLGFWNYIIVVNGKINTIK